MVLVARHQPLLNPGLAASLSSHSDEFLSSLIPVPSHRRQYVPKPAFKGLFAGSGNGAMSQPFFAQSVIDLTKRSASDVNLLYIGTASYDLPKYREIQTSAFAALGCSISSLEVAHVSPLLMDLEAAVSQAHVILVSGGNTLYAMDRWRSLGLDGLLKDAAEDGVVMTGGSAGCICWFDGGHSDSMDPDTYRDPMLKANHDAKNSRKSSHYDEGTTMVSNPQDPQNNHWSYIRVEGLGILPGLVCPHFDRIQSNGIPRLVDFDSMMKRHSMELGLGIDHFAALEINGSDFRVLSLPGETGSVPQDGGSMPGVWIKYVDEEGDVQSTPCPSCGKVEDLLQVMVDPSKHLWPDERVKLCRAENPGPSTD